MDLNLYQLTDFDASDMQRNQLDVWTISIIIALNWNATTPRFLVARLERRVDQIKFANVLQSIEDSLSSKWTLKVNRTKYKLQPSFHKYVEFAASRYVILEDVVTMTPTSWRHKDDTLGGLQMMPFHFVMFRRQWDNLAEYERQISLYSNGGLTVNRLFFCPLIQLEPHEYNDYDNFIFVSLLNRTMDKGDFLKLRTTNGKTDVRICAHEIYGQERPTGRGKQCYNTVNNVIVLLIFQLVTRLFQNF